MKSSFSPSWSSRSPIIVIWLHKLSDSTKGGSEKKVKGIRDHTLNDVILYLFLQLPECIAYYLSNNVTKCMVFRNQPITLVASRSISSFLVNGVLGMF